jgi:hypothetical protein
MAATRTAAVAATARRAGAFRGPDRVTEDRPGLRVVEARRERRRRIGVIALIGLAVAMFAVVGSQTLIVSQQAHIDHVNTAIADAESRARELHLELAQLQSPQHITSEAATRLGMIPAPTPVYLQPRLTDDARAGEMPPAPTPTTVPAATPTTVAAKAVTTPTTVAAKSTSTSVSSAAKGR